MLPLFHVIAGTGSWVASSVQKNDIQLTAVSKPSVADSWLDVRAEQKKRKESSLFLKLQWDIIKTLAGFNPLDVP